MPFLSRVKRQVSWALETAPKLAPKGTSPARTSQGEMWIVANGFSNAFYAVNETLKNVEAQSDPILQRVRKEWWSNGAEREFSAYLGKFRNALTHQGVFELEAKIEWEVDHDHDTVNPRYSHPFVDLIYPDGSRRAFTFPEWIYFCFEWWELQIRELERLYVAAGGVVEPEPKDSWVWMGINRPIFDSSENF